MFRNLLILTIILLLPAAVAAQTDSSSLVWPTPPERARIKHLLTISSIEDFKTEKGFFSKMLGAIFGEEGSSQWLVQPVGIAVSSDGVIYVADPGAKGIHILNQKEKKYSFVGETKLGAFISPVGLAFAPDGTLFISDSQRGDILATRDNFDVQFEIKDRLVRPTGIQIIGGKLYVTDTEQHKVLIYDLNGTYIGEFGKRGDGNGEFNYPVQLAGRDTLAVVDALNYRIERFTGQGAFVGAFGSQGNVTGTFASPKAVAFDSDGNLYVTDALMDNFQIFNPVGQLLLVVGKQGARSGEFMSPGGICIDAQDRIYIVDTLNRRIQIFQYLR
jgi:DNA-binding beta-propeller fold protein YncE